MGLATPVNVTLGASEEVRFALYPTNEAPALHIRQETFDSLRCLRTRGTITVGPSVVIERGTVILTAAEAIVIGNGFSVLQDSTFIARTDPCAICNTTCP